MKKKLFLIVLVFLTAAGMYAQSTNAKPSALGISFVFYDYLTPERIRTSSFRQVLKQNQWADINEMAPGLAITYFKGLHRKFDLATTLTGAFTDKALPNRTPNGISFLLEGEAVLQYKVLPSNYMFTPYLFGGLGASKFGGYYGAFMPLGGGFKLNFFDEAEFFINAKYNMPVSTQTVKGHFIYGLGIAGAISKTKETL